LLHDDALSLKNLELADVILVGVSRSGKTPICLYLAMHFGLRAANYPLTEDDFIRQDLPQSIKDNIGKVLALSIMPNRLSQVREKRSPGSQYATLSECQSELRQAQKIFNHYKLDVLDTTSSSIEELATKIITFLQLDTNQHFIIRDN
jgi:regulator of PEP synthase PpsR (kinase-PPPase family)